MSVAQTSLFAYRGIKAKLGSKQMEVYKAIETLGVATNEAIAEYLDWPINRVTGRVTELRLYGAIGQEGLGKNKSGVSAKLWSVRDMNDKNLMDMAMECEG